MTLLRHVTFVAVLAVMLAAPARAADFPFGLEVTLETAQLPGAKRLPTIEIGENGEAKLDLWCKSGPGQFSVAGDTVIFLAGTLVENACTPSLAQADDALVTALAAAANWKRQGDFVSFVGPTPLTFRINTN